MFEVVRQQKTPMRVELKGHMSRGQSFGRHLSFLPVKWTNKTKGGWAYAIFSRSLSRRVVSLSEETKMTEMTQQWRAQVSNSGLSVLRQTGPVGTLTKMQTGAEAINAAENILPSSDTCMLASGTTC